jgi:hypothetical protein
METSTLKTKKTTSVPNGTKLNPTKKPLKKPKVILGGGTKYGWVSDTLFDEDLKGW